MSGATRDETRGCSTCGPQLPRSVELATSHGPVQKRRVRKKKPRLLPCDRGYYKGKRGNGEQARCSMLNQIPTRSLWASSDKWWKLGLSLSKKKGASGVVVCRQAWCH